MENKEKKHKVFTGVVVSDKMDKTVLVDISRYVKHAKYKKYQKITKKFKAHDEANACKVGDKVSIEECRPISKGKSFKVVEAAAEAK